MSDKDTMLGPLLFLIYIDDVSKLQFTAVCILNLYADDMLLYKRVDSFSVFVGAI